MGKITFDLIRKRAEHNEGEVQSLEEISLHQEKLERIELLDKVCRNLKILLLQNNSIPKIENLGRLKQLEYLNLAMNLVEKVEGLERCESLKKLDLMLNFISDLTSVRSLEGNIHLEQLYLSGNPCVDLPGYRDYVVAVLPQLRMLDGVEVTKSERITARQRFPEVEAAILEVSACPAKEEETEASPPTIEDNEAFWAQPTENSPSARRELNRRLEEQEALRLPSSKDAKSPPKPELKLFTNDGRPLNVNQAKLHFTLDQEGKEALVLDLAVPKHLCTSLVDLDIQPTYITVKVKGKVLQLTLPEEVQSDLSSAARSQITGHLIITMPKVKKGNEGTIIVDLRTTKTISAPSVKNKDSSVPPQCEKRDTDDDDLPPPLI